MTSGAVPMAHADERFPMKYLRALSQNGKSSTQTTTTRNATPSPGPGPAKEDLVGEWLCADGPYRKYIQALSKTNPGLTTADPNNKDIALKYGNAKVVLLESPAEGPPKFELKEDFDTCAQLQEHFRGSPRGPEHDHGSRRIYIMEGLAPDYVATIGGHFFMEPNFWLRQERTCVWSNDFTPVSDALPQPSLLDPDKSFHVQYCELRQFNKALESRPFFCGRTRRHVGMTAPRGKDDTTTAILRRKVSWWCDQIEGHKSWDVVILCDPQLKELTPNPKKHILKREPQVDQSIQATQDIKADDKLINTPFQGGYIDFMPPPRPINGQVPPLSDHPHESMLGDLIYYYTKDCARLDKDNDWLSPTTSAFFLKKIVAAHYLQLADYIKAMLPSLELKLTTAWVEEREQWKGLQIISRRCGNYRDDIEDTLLSLGYPLEIPRERGKEGQRRVYDWRDCEIDYQYVYFRLKILKERADNLMTSMTGLASIAGNRQNLEEAKRVKRLNLLALLFIPLAYTSSLFSMQDEYAPNKPQFWVYWVCAIGVVVFTSVVTFILDRALNDAAEWTIPFKKLLVGGEKGTDMTLNRVTTGFYGPSKRTRTG